MGKTYMAMKFEGQDLREKSFSGDVLQAMKFVDCNLEGVSFEGAILQVVKFVNCNLEGADFTDSSRQAVKFVNCEGVECGSEPKSAQERAKQCPKCGTLAKEEDDLFCWKCGQRFIQFQ